MTIRNVLHVCRSPYVLCNCDYTLLPSSEDVSCPQWISAVMDESVLHCDLNDSIGHGAGVACRGHGHCNSRWNPGRITENYAVLDERDTSYYSNGMHLPELAAGGYQVPPCSESLCILLKLDITIQIHTRVVVYSQNSSNHRWDIRASGQHKIVVVE